MVTEKGNYSTLKINANDFCLTSGKCLSQLFGAAPSPSPKSSRVTMPPAQASAVFGPNGGSVSATAGCAADETVTNGSGANCQNNPYGSKDERINGNGYTVSCGETSGKLYKYCLTNYADWWTCGARCQQCATVTAETSAVCAKN
jgi:hypothetical protein